MNTHYELDLSLQAILVSFFKTCVSFFSLRFLVCINVPLMCWMYSVHSHCYLDFLFCCLTPKLRLWIYTANIEWDHWTELAGHTVVLLIIDYWLIYVYWLLALQPWFVSCSVEYDPWWCWTDQYMLVSCWYMGKMWPLKPYCDLTTTVHKL